MHNVAANTDVYLFLYIFAFNSVGYIEVGLCKLGDFYVTFQLVLMRFKVVVCPNDFIPLLREQAAGIPKAKAEMHKM